jgi:hypothetical protein
LASGYHRRIALSRSGSISILGSGSGAEPAVFGRRWHSVIAVEYTNGFRVFFCCPRPRSIATEITR